jgi:ATP-binding cassette subfamily G (WHITE) protein 2 (PDR)
MMAIMGTIHLMAGQYMLAEIPRGEILLYRRRCKASSRLDVESMPSKREQAAVTSVHMPRGLKKQTAILHWNDIVYEVSSRGSSGCILGGISGWAKPGTLTALMGATRAGKTTLLNVLAGRTTTENLTGGIHVDGSPRRRDFPRKLGYSQQEDIHLSTATLREALTFSALLRQSLSTSEEEKIRYVDEVLEVTGLVDWADAIVGVPGEGMPLLGIMSHPLTWAEGLNVEQRRKLTIAVVMVAKPEILFLGK